MDCIVAEASTLYSSSTHGYWPGDKGCVTSHGIPVHGSVFQWVFFLARFNERTNERTTRDVQTSERTSDRRAIDRPANERGTTQVVLSPFSSLLPACLPACDGCDGCDAPPPPLPHRLVSWRILRGDGGSRRGPQCCGRWIRRCGGCSDGGSTFGCDSSSSDSATRIAGTTPRPRTHQSIKDDGDDHASTRRSAPWPIAPASLRSALPPRRAAVARSSSSSSTVLLLLSLLPAPTARPTSSVPPAVPSAVPPAVLLPAHPVPAPTTLV